MTSRRLTIFSGLFATAGLGFALAGCPDPEGALQDFTDRYDEIHQTTSTGGGGVGGGVACVPAMAGELDGRYMFALSARLGPKKAFALDAQMTTTANGDGLSVALVLQPLSAADQTTEVSTPLSFSDLPVAADGTFTWDLGMITLPGAANPITGADVEATLTLAGELCAGDRAGFVCGPATGQVTAPLMADLSPGSNFTMQAEVGGELPPPVINCAKDPAVY